MKKKTIIITLSIVVIIIIAIVFGVSRNKHDLVWHTAVVEEKTIEMTVTATGYVQPVDKVDVGTQVSGVIEKIYVDFNSQVKQGQLLAELDKSTLQEKVLQSKASVSSAQSDLLYAQQNFDRTKQLYETKAATQTSYEDAVNKLAQAKNALTNAKANLHQAEVNLSYANIYSPINGVVLNRAVDQGQTVAASFSTPTLFTIAKDLKKMQVEADVDEADIGSVKVGQKVSFSVDSYTDEIFEGTVQQVRLQPVVTNNVVTYTVIVEAPNPEEKLFPGMTANITIITQSETGSGIPAEALHFTPSAEILKKINLPAENMSHSQNAPSSKEKNDGDKIHNDQKKQQVWIKTTEGAKPQMVKIGTTDGINTIILDGLKAGETVVLSASLEKKSTMENQAATNPLMPKRPGRR